ncbi:PrsW family intramembrane metalloprotease, partial [Candidatus Kaiserbacteria bacterium]|nr:PrsW family intramembrane metalloprotease [Candidatus Kaiserbacteria bacterium]
KKPEPRLLLLLAFATGMLAVLITLPIEAVSAQYIPLGFLLILAWAATEEIAKFVLAWITVLRRSAVDEPIDNPVYLITVALGFATLENAFFLFTPIAQKGFFGWFVTGDLRFIGATLIHVLCSSLIGGALALAHYGERREKILYGGVGVILAIALHTTFNSLIISTGAGSVLVVFMGVWVGIVFLLLALERVKIIRRPAWWEKIFMRRNAQ